jgi:hypothetical protein
VAACDKDILGKDYSEGGIRLSASHGFYGGEEISVEELEAVLSKATIANLTGNKVVGKAVELGFIDEDNILEVAVVKHAQFVLL